MVELEVDVAEATADDEERDTYSSGDDGNGISSLFESLPKVEQ